MDHDKFRAEIQEVLKKYPGIKSVTIKAVAQYDILIETDGQPQQQEVKNNEVSVSKTPQEIAMEDMMNQLNTTGGYLKKI